MINPGNQTFSIHVCFIKNQVITNDNEESINIYIDYIP
jgi:hypothetical protein